MATRNINNYINELLNEVHEPGHQRERQFFDPTKNPMDGIRDDQKSTKKPKSRESFPSRGGKNKRLARAAQADKTGDAYMAQVMGQGKGTSSSEKAEKAEKDIRMRDGARPESGIRTPDLFNRGGGSNIMPRRGLAGDLVIRDTKERREGDDLISARMNRGSNPQARPPRPGEKPRSLSGEIQSDFINPQKRTRMGY